MFMNVAVEEKVFYLQNNNQKEYEYASDEEVREISKRILEKHKEAYTALANA